MTVSKNDLVYNFAVMRCKESQFLEIDPGGMTTWQIVLNAAIMLACSLLAFPLSYPVTVAIFKRKEYQTKKEFR